MLVALAVGFGLFELRAELDPVAYLNDSSVHAQMARWAGLQMTSGHLPFDGWWPYLGLGSPQFLHYQSLSSVITGAVGLAVGQATAFCWLLYLLLATWPISVYCAARLFGFDRYVAGVAALVSPLVVSRLGIGYGEQTYLWIGFGLTTQLWAMWTLPLAWGATFRAFERPRWTGPAFVLVSLTVALHFMTGYLAILAIPLLALLRPRELRSRLRRAAILAAGTAACSAWVVVPVLVFKHWASINEFLAGTPIANSYGARVVLSWLASGQLLDAGRMPVLTLLAAIGAIGAIVSWRHDPRARAVLVLFAASLVLFFGRPTLGPLTRLIPGSEDLFLRRFLMGVQLACILLAGMGAVGIARALVDLGRSARSLVAVTGSASSLEPNGPAAPHGPHEPPRPPAPHGPHGPLEPPGRPAPHGPGRRPWRIPSGIGALLACVLLLAVLSPAWREVAAEDALNARDIAYQRSADANSGAELDAVLEAIKADGGGRVYAGLPQNWGASFTVGYVPVFKYLEQADIAEVGYTLRTASLMTDPEQYFDEANPADFAMFGIRYLILPPGHLPPLAARLVMRDGSYLLWEIPGNSYIQVVETRGTITANRSDIGRRTRAFLDSHLPDKGIYPTVAYGGAPAATPTLRAGEAPLGSPGRVLSERSDLVEGELSTVVHLRRKAVVVLSASYDPGWTVTVDGHPARTEMVAPALVGVTLGPGTHRVRFVYAAYPDYPELFAVGAAGLVLAGLGAGWPSLEASPLKRRARRNRRADLG